MLLLATFFFLFFSLWFQHVKGTASFKSSSKQTVFPFCSQDELNYQEETFFGELSRLEHCPCKGREYQTESRSFGGTSCEWSETPHVIFGLIFSDWKRGLFHIVKCVKNLPVSSRLYCYLENFRLSSQDLTVNSPPPTGRRFEQNSQTLTSVLWGGSLNKKFATVVWGADGSPNPHAGRLGK